MKTTKQAQNQLQLVLGKDPATKEAVIMIKVGEFTELILTLDESRALIESLTRLHTMHVEYLAHQVERARAKAKLSNKTRGVESGRGE